MRLFRSIIFITVVTVLALAYVHQQVELVKLSYAIGSKEIRLKDMLDHNGALGYDIDNLEAPSRLEGVLLAQKIDLIFPKRGHVIRMAKLKDNPRTMESMRSIGLERKVNIFGNLFDFFGQPREAQAKEK